MAVRLRIYNLDCRKCEKHPILKIENGCVEDSPIKEKWDVDGWKVSRCPLKVVWPQSYDRIEAYNMFKLNNFPNDGTWRQQPIKFNKAIQIIDKEVEKITEWERTHDS